MTSFDARTGMHLAKMMRVLTGVMAGAVIAGLGMGTAARAQTTPVTQAAAAVGATAYASHCAICHGEHMEGILPGFPPLTGVGRKMSEAQLADFIHAGKGRMPGFPKVQGEELTGLVHYLTAGPLVAGAGATVDTSRPAAAVEAGGLLFRQSCAFCHGRDAAGGETGPDLTRSKLVLADVKGNKIGEVVRNGRLNTEKKMPAFNFSEQEIENLSAFIHGSVAKAVARPGGRRGVDVSDLQTGDVAAGKKYFNGAGTCAKCHSATGDLAGIASRLEGLQLEMQMLSPRGAKNKGTVTLANGKKVTGTVAYQDEFTVGLRDSEGVYRSWPLDKVNFVLDAPVKEHAALFPKYTDKDIHDLMAYIQTLK